ncbi:hypothetical protein Dcar01_03543 [Deinococcus carri]|uniref:Terminase small subunit n=1 Tax=Deinococcus carri TaxID=1211323 RepID=A0ABP9WBT1_9DEIO
MTEHRTPNTEQPTAEELGAALNPRHRKFADLYLNECRLNASAAARRSGYKDHRQGWRIVRLPDVAAYIAAVMAESPDVMGAGEVAARLTIEARSTVDMDEFVTVAPTERTFWVPARQHEPVREYAKRKRVDVEDLDKYDLMNEFGASEVSETLDGEVMIKVATIAQDVVIDWAAAKAAGAISGMAVLKKNRDGSLEYRVKDPTKALQLLGQLHDMFGQRQVHQNPDGSPIKFIVGVSEDDL